MHTRDVTRLALAADVTTMATRRARSDALLTVPMQRSAVRCCSRGSRWGVFREAADIEDRVKLLRV